jgi:hypothetical protein
MKTVQHKWLDEWRVTELGVKPFGMVVYVKAIEWSLTTSDSTAQVRWTMCQLVWYLGQSIAGVSQSGSSAV